MWLRRIARTRRNVSASAPRPSYRPRLEALEDRCLMSAGNLDPKFGAGAGYDKGMESQRSRHVAIVGRLRRASRRPSWPGPEATPAFLA